MITHDRYQTAIYAGLLGVWTLNIITESPVVIDGPYCICAADVWVAGGRAGDVWLAGAQASDVHLGGGTAGQGDCC